MSSLLLQILLFLIFVIAMAVMVDMGLAKLAEALGVPWVWNEPRIANMILGAINDWIILPVQNLINGIVAAVTTGFYYFSISNYTVIGYLILGGIMLLAFLIIARRGI